MINVLKCWSQHSVTDANKWKQPAKAHFCFVLQIALKFFTERASVNVFPNRMLYTHVLLHRSQSSLITFTLRPRLASLVRTKNGLLIIDVH